MNNAFEQRGDDVLIRIRAVPGASRDEMTGLLGDRLKVRTVAAPEDGKANKAICSILASRLGIRPSQLSVASGHASRDKTILVENVNVHQVGAALGV